MNYTTVSSSDENTINVEVSTLASLDATALGYMSQVNTHAYGGTERAQLSAAAAADGKRLWMSEYGDSDGTGMQMATEIVNDLTTMNAKAWIYWQAIDSAAGWGFMANPLSNETTYTSTVNRKYYAMGNFSKFIRPGYTIVGMSDPLSVAAYDGVNTVAFVTVATTSVTENYSIANYGSGTWTVTPYQTSSTANLVALTPFQVTGTQFTYSMPANSITTFVVTKSGI
jgi:O-glycosyl hydrolase